MQRLAARIFNNSDAIYTLVRETLASGGIDPDKHKVFRYFLSLALSPENIDFRRDTLNDQDIMRSQALANTLDYLHTASCYGDPCIGNINDAPDSLLCAIAMMALPPEDGFFPRSMRILASGDFKPHMLEAKKLYQAAAHLHASGGLNGAAYDVMSPAERFLVELHAAKLCEHALAPQNQQDLTPLLQAVPSYGLLLAKSDSDMARYFKTLYEELHIKVPDLAVPRAASITPDQNTAKLYVFTGRRPQPARL